MRVSSSGQTWRSTSLSCRKGHLCPWSASAPLAVNASCRRSNRRSNKAALQTTTCPNFPIACPLTVISSQYNHTVSVGLLFTHSSLLLDSTSTDNNPMKRNVNMFHQVTRQRMLNRNGLSVSVSSWWKKSAERLCSGLLHVTGEATGTELWLKQNEKDIHLRNPCGKLF